MAYTVKLAKMLITKHYSMNQYCIAIVALLISFPAMTAEIYRCVDANGVSSFSQTPCPDEMVVGSSHAHKLWREMRTLVSEGYNINRLLGADVPSIIQCNKSSEMFNKELDLVNERLIQLSSVTHQPLFKAMEYLRGCGECRSSAFNYCKKASTQLDEEMNILLKLDQN